MLRLTKGDSKEYVPGAVGTSKAGKALRTTKKDNLRVRLELKELGVTEVPQDCNLTKRLVGLIEQMSSERHI